MTLNPTTRFTGRVDNYVRYRPGYPPELIARLAALANLSPSASVVADIGSGTGILTELILPLAKRVYAVEPNAAMRVAAEQKLGADPRFASVDAAAENTTLPPHSVDLITAGQSFHWFDRAAARREFARVLKPGGLVALIWNERLRSGTVFLEKFENVQRELAPDYANTRHKNLNETIFTAFFAPGAHQIVMIPNAQSLDLDALIGFALSLSYAPNPGHPNHAAFVAALKKLFSEESRNGRVEMRYMARLYLGVPGREAGAQGITPPRRADIF